MAEVAVTVIACVIELPLRIMPLDCPCCGEPIIIDRMRKLPDGTYEAWAVPHG